MGNYLCKLYKIKEELENYEIEYKTKITNLDEHIKKIRKFEIDYKIRLENINDFGLCPICFLNPKNGTIIHGDTAHTCCCKECGIVLKECPICRASIEKVVVNFHS